MRPTSRLYAALALAACLATAACDDSAEPAAAGPETATVTDGSLAAPPEGHRWVGDRGVVVAVPDWWTTGDTDCLMPVEDTVFVESGAVTDCQATVPGDTYLEVSSLAVLDTRSAHGERIIAQLEPDGSVDGEPVLAGEDCLWFWTSPCRTVVAAPDSGVAFALYVDEPGDIDPAVVRDSLTVLPDGWTTVPLRLGDDYYTPTRGDPPSVTRRYSALLEKVGLEVRVEDAEIPEETATDVADLPQGSLLVIEPTPGTPIREGGEVVLTVMPSWPR